jgi:Fic family protein
MAQDDRHSHAETVRPLTNPDELARQEARNGLKQFDLMMEQISYWLHPDRPFRLRPSAVLSLNRVALEGISEFAGIFRPGQVKIGGSKHTPPPAHMVPELVEHLCDYVNDNQAKSPIHLAAFTLWRMNWIHPFVDGNGRTARTISYIVLCSRLGYTLPGSNTIPEQIARDKKPYYVALEKVDESERQNALDTSPMESLLEGYLASQLLSVVEAARGGSKSE